MKLVISNLSIAYSGGAQTVRPIDGFDMTVESGELVLLNGPSGSGKTTLLSAIAGLLTPEAGSIAFDGEDVAALRGKARLRPRRDRIGMVFQSFNLIPSLTAVENVAVPLTVAGVSMTCCEPSCGSAGGVGPDWRHWIAASVVYVCIHCVCPEST